MCCRIYVPKQKIDKIESVYIPWNFFRVEFVLFGGPKLSWPVDPYIHFNTMAYYFSYYIYISYKYFEGMHAYIYIYTQYCHSILHDSWNAFGAESNKKKRWSQLFGFLGPQGFYWRLYYGDASGWWCISGFHVHRGLWFPVAALAAPTYHLWEWKHALQYNLAIWSQQGHNIYMRVYHMDVQEILKYIMQFYIHCFVDWYTVYSLYIVPTNPCFPWGWYWQYGLYWVFKEPSP